MKKIIIKFLYRRNKNHLFVLYINYIDYKRLEIKNILRKKNQYKDCIKKRIAFM